MQELKNKLIIESIEKSFDDFIESEAMDYINCYPLDYEHKVREGLIRSYGHEILIKKLNELYGEYIDEFEIINTGIKNNSFIIKFKQTYFIENISKYNWHPLYSVCDVYGFYISEKNNDKYTLYIEPKYSDEITEKVYDIGIVYHVTEHKNLKKILTNGLNPRNSKKRRFYTHRIFLTYGEYDEVLKKSKEISFNSRFFRPILIKIDISKSNMCFYMDPSNGENCIYTYDYIKPEWIIDYEQIGI